MKTVPHTMADVECVWMKAGVLNYRLCDKQFECEHCDLDRALRNSPSEVTAAGSGRHAVLANAPLKENELVAGQGADYVLSRHFWRVKKLFNGTCYISLDPLVLPVFEDALLKNVCCANQFVNIGDPVVVTSAPWGSVSLTADFPFKVLGAVTTSINPALGNQWLAIIEPALPYAAIDQLSEAELETRMQSVASAIKSQIPDFEHLGVTMHDGGKRINRLYGILGGQLYKKVVSILFEA